MRAFRPLLATSVMLVAFVLVVWLARRPQPTPSAPAAGAATPAGTQPAAAEAVTPSVPTKLVLYFPGDDGLLHRELHDVPELPLESVPRIKLVMEELIGGSHSGLPSPITWAATLEAVFLDKKGSAYVDISPPPPDGVQGTDGELILIYAVVNSISANCPTVARTQILFGGKEVATLGHLDLSRPLAPMLDLVAP
jgi:hypothetical protein